MKHFAIFLFLFFSFFINHSQAQEKKAIISFEKVTHNFGQILEDDGECTYEFKFTNIGDAPLVVNRVQSSCGCTTPDWSKEPIAPGGSGLIKATYSPKGRPGFFNKNITVYSNAAVVSQTLIIKGDVIKDRPDPEKTHPYTLGSLRLKENTLDFKQVGNTETVKQYIEVFNLGESGVSLTFENISPFLELALEPQIIQANDVGNIVITYKGLQTNSFGNISGHFDALINAENKISIPVKAFVIEDFSKMSGEDKINAPKLNTSPAYITFDKLPKERVQKFRIANSGKTNLIIHSMTSDSEMVKISGGSKEIKAGEIVEFTVTIDKKENINTDFNAQISIICNDPKTPMKDISVVCKSKK